MEIKNTIKRIRLELINIHNTNFPNKIYSDGTDATYLSEIFCSQNSNEYKELLSCAFELEGLLETYQNEPEIEIIKALNNLETRIVNSFKEV